MKILLDIDDTALIYDKKTKEWKEHPRLNEIINRHEVLLYSGNPDIEKYFEKWKVTGYFPKLSERIPRADVLIDNNCDLHKNDVIVKKSYKSIDSFFRYNRL